jgi:hypothetical protein
LWRLDLTITEGLCSTTAGEAAFKFGACRWAVQAVISEGIVDDFYIPSIRASLRWLQAAGEGHIRGHRLRGQLRTNSDKYRTSTDIMTRPPRSPHPFR